MADEPDSVPDAQVKTCFHCQDIKPKSDFHRNKNAKDGFVSVCKTCAKAAREAGPKLEYSCKRCGANCKKDKPGGRSSYCGVCATEVRRERDRARRPGTKVGFSRICERCAATFVYRGGKQVVCPDCVKFVNAERGKEWARKNRDRRLAQAKAYNDKKRGTPRGHLEWSVRAAVKRSISKETKSGRKTFDLLGYTVDELKSHLERQFQPGMSWENYGEWHIDHRVPLSSFKYDSPDCPEFKLAWAITNLQPLWWRDNLSKGAKATLLV